FAVADLDVLGGHVEDAFDRLVRFIALHPGDDRETARAHLVDLYTVVGTDDPRVQASRRRLAAALF
ncbi:tetratricopeptide repeat protein, partial [Micrococcus sp. HSID17227]|uniref:tetratricopeptide repeat protein n=1 Tax=Micrococcus sp. HSID17227 TaxID=2419506 RepID=UPI000F933620